MNHYEDEIGSKEQMVVLRTLAKSAAKPGCLFIEIGSWYGGSTIILGKIAKKNKGRLIAIDWWKGSEGTELSARAETENIFFRFWERICNEGLEHTVIPVRADSSMVPEFLKEEQADLIFIDGDHRYDVAKRDIQLFLPIVRKKGGIFCGHDCEGKIRDYNLGFLDAHKNMDCHETVHCGVVLAVGESFTDYSVDHSIWSVKYSDKKGDWTSTKLKFSGIKNKRQLTPPKISSTATHELIRYGKYVYAVPRSSHDIDITDESVRNNKKVLKAKTVKELEKVAGPIIPLQIEEFNGFNIVDYKSRYYAISFSVGEINIQSLKNSEIQKYQNKGQILTAASIYELRRDIIRKQNSVPVLIEGYRGYNIVLYKDKFFAISQALGPFDLTKVKEDDLNRYSERSECIIAKSSNEAKLYVDVHIYKHLSQETSELSARMSELQSTLAGSEENTAALNSKIEKLVDQLAESAVERNSRISELQSKLSESEEATTIVKYEMARLNELLANENTKNSQKITKLENVLVKSDEKTRDLITEMEKIHRFMANQLSEKDDKISELQGLLAESDEKVKALNSDKERLAKEMVERDHRLGELQGLLAESDEKATVLNTDNKKLQERLSLDSAEQSRKVSELESKLSEAMNEIDRPKPALVEEGFKGFNIILYKDKYHAISQAVGPVDISNFETGKIKKIQDQSKWVIGDTLDDARLSVKKLVRWKKFWEHLGFKGTNRDKTGSSVNVIKEVSTLRSNVENAIANFEKSQENIEVLYDSGIKNPSVSLILLDWSCRESFHTIDYLNQQTVPRDEYEVIWIEFYDRRSDKIDSKIKESLRDGRHPYVDKWIRMNYPIDTSYHKHRMYNLGILESKAPIVSILDSDAMLEPTFIGTILVEFEQNERLALHFEQIRNFDQKYYPFNFPSVEEVVGEGCVNATNGIPNVFLDFSARSLKENLDLWHTANYGACLCARREDLIAIGGSDEHLDYLGHVCGPYELTVRLINAGIPDKLQDKHFLYHVYHPHQGGGDNDYCGPNNGRGMSLTAMEIPKTGRVFPLLENEEIMKLRLAQTESVSSHKS